MHVDVDGTRHWFDVEGAALVPDGPEMRQRPTVVLLHGGPGGFDHSYLKPDFARLAESAQVVYLDLYGHGRSEWGAPEDWSFELCGDKVREFCDAVGIDSPIVLGHSLGGMVALTYAARHPDHPGALVLQSTMGRFDHGRMVEHFRRIGGDGVAAVVQRSYGGGGDPVTSEEWASVWKLFGRWVPLQEEEARTVANAELNPVGIERMRSFDVLDQLGVVACPTLVCVGELDPCTPVAAAQEITGAIPGARLEVIEGAGHFTWRDSPERYWPLLSDFVESVDVARSR